ncbi:hypothetical protein EDF46_2478 [Frondihabitans sp. PhB188]|uniref:hypothetical protein n=1 Tax=Frondihabitans sp. PhB188 TaxID=2485200 RepID=UPI000FB2D95C|nr:hypothetical protein [Frondihabitans sp. PhB188]ROQ37034.1 hypothetical protein EDF46_2478 [Frondihabitans sp. PhB188]
MSAPRPRRRALTLTLAAATATGLVLAGVVPAMADTAAPAAPVTSTAAMPSPLGTVGQAAPHSRSARSAAPGASSRLLTPSTVVGTHPGDQVDPVTINTPSNRDQAVAGDGSVAGDTLYGYGYIASQDRNVLEQWTDQGWERLPVTLTGSVYQPVGFGGDLYFMTWKAASSGLGTSTLWHKSGDDYMAVKSFKGFTNLSVAGTRLSLLVDTKAKTTAYTYDGSKLAGGTASTTKHILGFIALGSTRFLWIGGSGWNAAIYRVDAKAITRVVSSPWAIAGTVWKGAVYFGGATSTSTGIYKFTGTSIVKATSVELAANFDYTYWIPTVGVYDGDLYFTADYLDEETYLYQYDGSTVTQITTMSHPGMWFYDFTEFDGKLFYGGGDGKHRYTWYFDRDAAPTGAVAGTTPTLSGTATVGHRLTSEAGAWTPTATLVYRWFRHGATGTSPIDGATGSSYVLTGADRGATVTVSIEGSGQGYETTTLESAASDTVATGTITLAPVISGTMKAGTTLTALPHLTPTTATRAYRWYRDGKPLAGASTKTYKVTSGDVGHKLQVAVHATATGYTDASATSAARTAKR